MSEPLVWSLIDPAAVTSLDEWIVEASIDLVHLRAQPVSPRLELRLTRVEHARARTHPSRFPLPPRTIFPVCAWKLSVEGLRTWEIDIVDDEVELMVKKTSGDADEVLVDGVVGRLTLRGRDLCAQAQLLGDTDFEVVRFLGIESFRTRAGRAQ